MDIVQSLQQSLPSRYTIEGEIGRGGMAVVYLAREDHPRRQVAIKVLEPSLTARLGRERFLREVDLASSLTHPHILPIYAAGDADGLLYYVMPYVKGESLDALMARAGKLPVAQALRIAYEVADALDFAHQHNVVHRDIKPPNILLPQGHAAIADFGIARAISVAESESITEAGHTLGTPAYMSPEQARGERVIDGRADIYSLGCVLYQMLTGSPPYGRGPMQEVLLRHLSDPVPSARAVDGSIEVELDGVIRKALAKEPNERYATAKDFARALGAATSRGVSDWTTAPVPVARPVTRDPTPGPRWIPVFGSMRRSPWLKRIGGAVALGAAVVFVWQLLTTESGSPVAAEPRFIDSVAVLPIDNLTGDPQFDHLADGITDEIITHLFSVPRLKVISRHSAEAVDEAQLTVPQLLDTLGVRHIVEGSLQVQGNQIRLNVQHIDSTDAHLGAKTYRAALTDRFEVQEQLADQVVAAFVQQVEGLSLSQAGSHTRHGPGHEPYLLGAHWLARRTPTGIRRAIIHFQDAIRRDPTHAAAYAGLSTAHALALTYRYRIDVDDYRSAATALAMAEQALRLDPDLVGAYAARGYIRMLALGPVEAAAADFERARRLQASSASAHSWYSRVLARNGDVEAAFAEAERAVSLDPLHPGRMIAVAYLALHLGRYEVAVRRASAAVNIEPDLMLPRAIQARALLLMGEALQCLEMSLGPHAVIRAICLHELGRAPEASAVVDSVIRVMEANPAHDDTFTDVVRAEDLATYYAWLGDTNRSLQWASRAYALSPVGVEARVLESALFDRVREAAPFANAIQRMRDDIWDRVLRESAELALR